MVSPFLTYSESLSRINALPDGTSLLLALPRALSAAHNSVREDAPSSCLEGTRVTILKEILSWSESPNDERPPVYWLSGLAGIGKSTIAKTVAERAQEKTMLGATFFFSRSDKPLRDPGLVLPMLAFQLAQSDSLFKEAIVDALKTRSDSRAKGTVLSASGINLDAPSHYQFPSEPSTYRPGCPRRVRRKGWC
jgi:hypothetical protein